MEGESSYALKGPARTYRLLALCSLEAVAVEIVVALLVDPQ